MSATTQPKRDGQLDAYYTPDNVARACVGTLGNLRGLACLEPHAGGGAFVRALMAAGGIVTANDIDPNAPGLMGLTVSHVGDFLRTRDMNAQYIEQQWIVGNPPFNEAGAHVRHALGIATVGVGFLLRLAFLEGAKRRAFWREHPAAEVHVLVNRPSFTGGGTDSAAYAWMVWRRGVTDTHLRHLDWRAS